MTSFGSSRHRGPAWPWLLGFGVVLSLLGGFAGVSAMHRLSSEKLVQGQVVRVDREQREETTGAGSRQRKRTVVEWHPVVRYSFEGRTRTFRSSASAAEGRYSQGDSVQVSVLPGEEDSAQVKGLASSVGEAFVLLVLGVGLAVVGVLLRPR